MKTNLYVNFIWKKDRDEMYVGFFWNMNYLNVSNCVRFTGQTCPGRALLDAITYSWFI